MATENEKLANSLAALREAQMRGVTVLRGTTEVSRVHLQRLLQNGWLEEVMKGWYIFSRPDQHGDATSWNMSYWDFVREYAYSRYGAEWSLSPEGSLDFWAGKTSIPSQTILRSPKGNNYMLRLPYNTSIFNLTGEVPTDVVEEDTHHIRIYPLVRALVYVSPGYYATDALAARTCLAQVEDGEDLLKVLLEEGATTRAGRVIGALRNIGKGEIADYILAGLRQFGHVINEVDPFAEKYDGIELPTSPYVARMQLMWQQMRQTVMDMIPLPTTNKDVLSTLADMDVRYKNDAYHSLSIEGYQVTIGLIERVAKGEWNPADDETDKNTRDALCAKGYYMAYQAVKASVEKILQGQRAGEVVRNDFRTWYQQMWMPHVNAGILRAVDLVGFRDHQVYIRGSQHTPLPQKAVRPAMDGLMQLLSSEPDARVRAVLGHFFFGYIHPYMDGNGRSARFLMNTMWLSGGYDWLIIPVTMRDEYMKALEIASCDINIRPFCELLLRAREDDVNRPIQS